MAVIPKAELKCFDDYEIERAFRNLVFDGNIDCSQISEDTAKEVGLVYLGYTHPNNLDFGGEVFEAWDMKDYYLSKNKTVRTVKKVFTDEELFTHYYKLKFILNEDEISDYCKKNKLNLEELENMFFSIEENPEKIADFRRTHSIEEIQEIANKFFEIDDDKERFQFVVDNNLFGCVLEGLLIDEEEDNQDEE